MHSSENAFHYPDNQYHIFYSNLKEPLYFGMQSYSFSL